eukprot:g54694.t1
MQADNNKVDKIVLDYLRKRGYGRAAQQLHQQVLQGPQHVSFNAREQDVWDAAMDMELSTQTQLLGQMQAFTLPDNSADWYPESYRLLQDWIDDWSLDRTKQEELRRLLWPVFVHTFLALLSKGFRLHAHRFLQDQRFRREHEKTGNSDHMNELSKLQDPQCIPDHHLAQIFLCRRTQVQMSNFAMKLLFEFLDTNGLVVLASLINKHIRFQEPGAEGAAGVGGANGKDFAGNTTQKIHWGTLPMVKELYERASSLHLGLEGEENSNKKQKIDNVDGKAKYAEVLPPAQEDPSRIPLPKLSKHAQEQMLQDLRFRVQLSRKDLPCVSLFTFLNSRSLVNCIAMGTRGADCSLVLAGQADSTIRFWDISDPITVERTMSSTSSSSSSSSASSSWSRAEPNEDLDDGLAASPSSSARLLGHSGPVYSVTFSPDTQFILSGSQDNSVRLWSAEYKIPLVTYKGHHFPVWDVAFSELGFYFASASYDRTARIWSTDKIYPLRILAGHTASVNSVRFHPNCNYVVTSSDDKRIRLWDVATGATVRLFKDHTAPVRSAVISPDGKWVASGAEDGQVIVSDLSTGNALKSFLAHSRPVTCLDWSSDGGIICSASLDCNIRLWDAKRGSSRSSNLSTESTQTRQADAEDLIKTFRSKQTGIYFLKFTTRNLLLSAGVYGSS